MTIQDRRVSHAAVLLTALLAVPGLKAEEGDVHVVLHGLSLHSQARGNGREWNQVNTGLALRYELGGAWAVQLGGYRNSLDSRSAYALADWTPLHAGPLQMGGFAGVTTRHTSGYQIPLGGVLRWQRESLAVALRLVPRKNAIIALELSWRI